MHPHQALIEKFYSAFSQRNWKTMVECYHTDVHFFDPVFENLDAVEVRAMWQMLCGQAKDFSLSFDRVEADEEYGTGHWMATYTFSKTGRKVTNDVQSRFRFRDGLIIDHLDDFDLWRWSRQALGLPGWLLGWTPFLTTKIRRQAKAGLRKFMQTAPPDGGHS